MNDTTWTGFRTGYLPATDTGSARIRVRNLETGKSALVPMDYSVGGGEPQHTHAIFQAAAGRIVRVERCGQWDKGYYYAVERVEGDA